MQKRRRKDVTEKHADILRSLGYKVKYKSNGKHNKQQNKAIVAKLWEKAKFYASGTKKQSNVEFHRYSKRSPRRKWKHAISSAQDFPAGFFIETPVGIEKGRYKMRLGKGGKINIETTDKRRIRDVIIRLDIQRVAKDPKKELERVLKNEKRPRQMFLTVNGYNADRQAFDDLEQFYRYLEDELIPRLRDAKFNFKKYGKEVFGLLLQYSPKGRRKAKGEGKEFDFESGGIFDESDKRVYSRRNYLKRGKYVGKKGKRKGT